MSGARMSGAFTVTRTDTNNDNSVAIKNLVKMWITLNTLQRFTPLLPLMM